jgi:hypothetical protein
MSEMPVAGQKWLVTSCAVLSLARGTHALIKRSILADFALSAVFLSVQVEESSV